MNTKLYFIFFLLINNTFSVLIFPFKTIHTFPEEDELKYLFKTSEIIELTIGEPNQKIKAKLDIKDFSFHLVQKINDINYYSQNISKTRIFERNTTYSFYDSQFSEGYVIKDNFFFKNNKNEIIEGKGIFFILAIDIKDTIPCFVGLNFEKESEDYLYNFISMLKYRDIINKKIWTIKYENENEGYFIVGDYYHNYNSKKYKLKEFVWTKIIFSEFLKGWFILFDNIYIGDKKSQFKTIATFSVEFNLIEGPHEVRKVFLDKVFIDNKCKEKLLYYKYIYVCDEDINYSNFPDLKFHNRELNYTFILNKDDLFMKRNNKIYFLMSFEKAIEDKLFRHWILGKPFMKKYNLIFDSEEKIIGIYKQEIKNSPLSFILIIILLFSILIALYILFKYVKRYNRKKRVYEIDENYEYITTIN